MKIDPALNLVLPIRENPADEEVLLWAYHAPLSREAFESSYRIIAAAKHMIWGDGVEYAYSSGQYVATLALKDAGRIDAVKYGLPEDVSIEEGGTAAALLAELKRLTSVLVPSENGWEMLPTEIALTKNVITAEEWREAERQIVFFTCSSFMCQAKSRPIMIPRFASVLGGSTTSLPPMDFAASCTTSTPEEISVAQASLVPS